MNGGLWAVVDDAPGRRLGGEANGGPGGPGTHPGGSQRSATGHRRNAEALDEADRLQAPFQLGEATGDAADSEALDSASTIERTPLPAAATVGRTPGMTVAEVAHMWLARGRGQTGPWVRSTRERYDRIIRRHIEASAGSATVPIGTIALSDLTVDMVADWSAANERVLARTTASIALVTLRAILRFAVRRGCVGHQPGRAPRSE